MLSPQDEEFLKSLAGDMNFLHSIGNESVKTLLRIVEELKERIRYLDEQNFGQHLLCDSIDRLEKERDSLIKENERYRNRPASLLSAHKVIEGLSKKLAEARGTSMFDGEPYDKIRKERDGLREESQERFDALRFIMPFLEEDDGTCIVHDYQLAIDRVKKVLAG